MFGDVKPGPARVSQHLEAGGADGCLDFGVFPQPHGDLHKRNGVEPDLPRQRGGIFPWHRQQEPAFGLGRRGEVAGYLGEVRAELQTPERDGHVRERPSRRKGLVVIVDHEAAGGAGEGGHADHLR